MSGLTEENECEAVEEDQFEDTSPDNSVVTNVYLFDNGMSMVYDQFGRQMPKYQGQIQETFAKLEAAGISQRDYKLHGGINFRQGLDLLTKLRIIQGNLHHG